MNESHKEKVPYPCDLKIRDRQVDWIVISQHYQIEHSSYMSDELIIKLVKKYLVDDEPKSVEIDYPWDYLTWEPLIYDDKPYRLIACLHAKQTNFIGIVNCHRVYQPKKSK